MVKRCYISLILSILFCINLSAQDFDPSLSSQLRDGYFSPASPEAAAMVRYGDGAKPDLNTGAIGLNIPIYTYRDHDFEVPVALCYSSQGYRPGQDPGSVGNGWHLSCGGAITREVRGLPDESRGRKLFSKNDDGLTAEGIATILTYGRVSYWQVRQAVAQYNESIRPTVEGYARRHLGLSELCDTVDFAHDNELGSEFLMCSRVLDYGYYNTYVEMEPDIYHYSFLGHSGSFILQPDGKVLLLETDSPSGCMEITYHWSESLPLDGTWFSFSFGDGFRYDFDARETVRSFSDASGQDDGNRAIAAWRLSRITAPNGRTVTFSYLSDTQAVQTSVQAGINIDHTTMNVPGANPTHLWLEPGYLSEKVVLTNAVTPCLLQTVSISGGSVISFSYTASSGRRFLSDVQVRNASGRTVRSCSLSGTGVAGSAVRFLKSVSIPGLGTWAFDYIGEDSSAYGGADAMAWMTDWDGFYNGSSFENTVSGAGASSMPSKAATLKAARQPSLAAASLTMLSSVTWPTGGRTGFSYALNSYESSCPSPGSAPEPVQETTAPGLRLAAADSYDLDGTQLRHVSYAYDGGVLLRKPAIYFNYSIGSQNLNFDREVVNTLSNMGFGKDPGVVYSRVTELVSRGASSPAAGTATTEYEFFGPGDGESGIVMGGPCTLPWNVVDWNFGVTDRGSEWDTFRSWTSGLYSGRLKRVTAYRGSDSGPVMISRRSFSCGSYVQKWVADEAAQDNREPYAEWPTVWMCSAQHCVIVNPCSAYTSGSVRESFDTSGSLLCSVPSSASVDALGRVSAGQTTDSGGLALRTEYQYVGQTPYLQSVTVRRGGTLVSRRGYTYTQRSGAAGYTYCRPASVTRTPVSSSGGAGTDQTVVAFTRFDAFDNVTRSVDAMGNRTDWGWDSSGQYLVSQSRYPAGSSGASLTTSWSWMPLVGVTSVSSPSGKTVRYSYDSCGRLEDVSDTAGDTLMQYAYHLSDAGGAFSWMRTRTFRTAAQAADDLTYYNGLGYPVMERNVLFSPGYDLGKPLTYDALGREDHDWLPAPFEDVGYSENEWADFFLPAQADVLTYYQDLYGSEPEADEDPVPVRPFTEKTMEFTPEGRPLSSALPGERYHLHPTAYEYLAGTIDGRSVTGISSTDGDGRETVEWKDYEDRTVARDRVAGGVTARTLFRYDRRGNLTEVVTPEGSSYTYTYDALSRVISKTIPGKEAETFTYDALDRIVTSQDGNQRAAGVTIRYYYDALGNLTLKTAVRGGVTRTLEEHTYSTSSGLLTGEKFYKLTADGWVSSSDYLGRTYTYDSEERVTSVVETDYPLSYSLTTDCSYDLQGNVTQRTETLAKGGTTLSVTTERGYDARSRPISETVRLGNTTVSTVARSYDELGRPAQSFYGTGAGRISEGFAYTIQGWPSYRGGSLMTEGYGYEGTSAPSWTGKITRWDWRHLAGAGEAAASYPARSETLAYDGFGRLAGSAMAPGNSWSERSISYDLDGNLLHLDRYQADASAPDAALSFTYNGNHRTGYSYDANGNVTFDPLRGFEISHNLLNLPSEVRIPAGTGGLTEDVELAGTVFYADGTRAGVIDPGTGEWTSRYIGSLIYSGTDGSETLVGVVTADGFIDCGNGISNPQMQYFLRDHLGSVRVVATDRDNVLNRTDYLPFGARMTGNGLPEDSSSRSARFGFAGKENEMWDGQASTAHWLPGERYQHFGARTYDPASCIFLQTDPLAEKYYGVSPYAYCDWDPVNYSDLDGRDKVIKTKGNRKIISATYYVQPTKFNNINTFDAIFKAATVLNKQKGLTYNENGKTYNVSFDVSVLLSNSPKDAARKKVGGNSVVIDKSITNNSKTDKGDLILGSFDGKKTITLHQSQVDNLLVIIHEILHSMGAAMKRGTSGEDPHEPSGVMAPSIEKQTPQITQKTINDIIQSYSEK